MNFPSSPYGFQKPMKSVSAKAVIRDDDGRILIVKPTYRPYWQLPGGAVENLESPAEACKRELWEELQIRLEPKHLLCIEYRTMATTNYDELLFYFDFGRSSDELLRNIQRRQSEIAAFDLVTPPVASCRLNQWAGRTLQACLASSRTGRVSYLEHHLS